ncbi:MAG: hypothetical protein IJ392_08485, partial [Clostridia bacterium]|nr:hypothetical protein [Clostridia bacterium]
MHTFREKRPQKNGGFFRRMVTGSCGYPPPASAPGSPVSSQFGLVDKSRLFCCNPIHRNKKDADGRHPIHLIILLRFMAAAERRQWSS